MGGGGVSGEYKMSEKMRRFWWTIVDLILDDALLLRFKILVSNKNQRRLFLFAIYFHNMADEEGFQ